MTGILRLFGKPAVEDDKLYFVSGCYNGLFMSDMNEREAHLLCDIPWSNWSKKICAADCYKVGGKIYCVAIYTIVEVAEYDIESDTLTITSFEKNKGEIIHTCLIDNKIWMFPKMLSDHLVYYDIREHKIVEQKEWHDWINTEKLDGETKIGAQRGNEVVITRFGSRSIIRTEYPFHKFEVIDIPVEEELWCPFYWKGRLYISSQESCTLFSYEESAPPYAKSFPVDEKSSFVRAFAADEQLYLMSSTKIYLFENEELKLIEIPELTNDNEKLPLFASWIEKDKQLFFLPWHANVIVKVHKDSRNFECQNISFTSGRWLKYIKPFFREGNASLEDLLEYINLEKEESGRDIIDNDGEKIYRVLAGKND